MNLRRPEEHLEFYHKVRFVRRNCHLPDAHALVSIIVRIPTVVCVKWTYPMFLFLEYKLPSTEECLQRSYFVTCFTCFTCFTCLHVPSSEDHRYPEAPFSFNIRSGLPESRHAFVVPFSLVHRSKWPTTVNHSGAAWPRNPFPIYQADVLQRENAIDEHGPRLQSIKPWSISCIAKKSVEEVVVFSASSCEHVLSRCFCPPRTPYKYLFHVCPSSNDSPVASLGLYLKESRYMEHESIKLSTVKRLLAVSGE